VEQREIFPITDLDPEYFARLLNVNVVGTFHCLKEEMKAIKDGGSIVNVGSIASHYGTPGTSGKYRDFPDAYEIYADFAFPPLKHTSPPSTPSLVLRKLQLLKERRGESGSTHCARK